MDPALAPGPWPASVALPGVARTPPTSSVLPPHDPSALLSTPGWPRVTASSLELSAPPVLELPALEGPQNVCTGDFRVQRFVKWALWSALEPICVHVCVCAYACARTCMMD